MDDTFHVHFPAYRITIAFRTNISYFDTFDGAKPRLLGRGRRRHSVSTLSEPRALEWGVEWVDFKEVLHGSKKRGDW